VSAAPYDYVIVGAGSAGCVLASRLSEDPQNRVCLVEAGPPDRSWLIRTPAAVGALMNHRRYNWCYQTKSQSHLHNRRVNLPRGRVLGGSSSINGMVYFRGHPADLDGWAAEGNAGWSYRELLPYFIRSERNEAWPRSAYHGCDGPMNVVDIVRPNPLVRRFVQAAVSLGYRECADFNAADPEGFGARQATIRLGRRESMATAFLQPARRRRNLTVLTEVLADRVVFEAGRATSITGLRDGRKISIAARREIILCAGAFGSPAILLRSGVGDPHQLRELNIPLTHASPAVGRNLQEHLVAPVQMRTASTEPYGLSWRALPRAAWNVLEYLTFQRGPLASNVFEATGFVRSDARLARPDIQLILMPAHRNASGFPIPLGHGYGILTALLRPLSRGRVSIESTDPGAAPVIDTNFLSEPADLDVLLRGLKIARRVLRAPAFAALRSTEVLPGDGVMEDEALRDHIRSTAVTVHHPTSTCRMGVDENCVVDAELRVRGPTGLRVVDASVFPSQISGNINAAVVMVAEKAADLIMGRPSPAPIDV
jgi:choline dehydrogenase